MEEREERFISFLDRASTILAVIAIAGAIFFIIAPALWKIFSM